VATELDPATVSPWAKRPGGTQYYEEHFIHSRFTSHVSQHIASDVSRILRGSTGCSADRLLFTPYRHPAADLHERADRNTLPFPNETTGYLYPHTHSDPNWPGNAT
jgi:hypothetical protein